VGNPTAVWHFFVKVRDWRIPEPSCNFAPFHLCLCWSGRGSYTLEEMSTFRMGISRSRLALFEPLGDGANPAAVMQFYPSWPISRLENYHWWYTNGNSIPVSVPLLYWGAGGLSPPE